MLPKFPKNDKRPSIEESIIDLLESIAQEELALAKILSSEARKIDAFVGNDLDFPTKPTNNDILNFNHSANRIIESVLMKEWLLLRKLEMVLQYKSNLKSCNCTDKKHTCGANHHELHNDE